jgi:putative transposase
VEGQWQGLWVPIGRQGIAKQCPERRKLHDDLVEQGETSCPNRIARLARLAGVQAQIGYKRRPGTYGGKPSVVVDNTLDRQFDVAAPDTAWVSDITYIKTYEGFLYLAVVIDLYSRRVIGWATQSRQPTDLVLQALLMAVWRRKPKQPILIHTDQGSQYTSRDWAAFLRAHNIEHSMSRRGNCHPSHTCKHVLPGNGQRCRRKLLQPTQT